MKKIIIYDKNALKELRVFNQEVQDDFDGLVRILRQEGRLSYPNAKKITKELFEIRVPHKEIYRGFYAYIWKEHIVILHFFKKKTQKIPQREIKTALNRLHNY